MYKRIIASSAAVLVLALAVPAFAGGAHCSGSQGATAWAGACLQRSANGAVTVAEVAAGSPAAKAGLKSGDVVVAVNGNRLADAKERSMCSASGECTAGSQVTYTVRRGSATREVKFKLVPMPSNARDKFAQRDGSFDPALAALVLPAAK